MKTETAFQLGRKLHVLNCKKRICAWYCVLKKQRDISLAFIAGRSLIVKWLMMMSWWNI